MTDDPVQDFNVLRSWKPGDAREISETILKELLIAGKFDSYSQMYEIDGLNWKIQSKVARPTGETFFLLLCLNKGIIYNRNQNYLTIQPFMVTIVP